MMVSALGGGEGIFDEIRAIEEVRMVERYTIVVCGPLPVREFVRGNSGGARGDGECREVRRLTNGWRGR
jgi:hypothetical protein